MMMALVVTVIGSLPLLFLGNGWGKWFVFATAPFMGVGLALMLNTGTSLISDVLGNDTKSGAFVYGCYSLLDKFANGFLLYWLVASYSEDPTALKWIVSMVPIGSAVGSAIFTYIGVKLYANKLQKISVGSNIIKQK